jgi:hypothetical protein
MPQKVKDPAVRQRRNKATTAAELPAPESPELVRVKTPPLTSQILGLRSAVKPQVQRWWRTIWREPMAARWLASDIEVLYNCAQIRQQIALAIADGKSVVSLMAELRQQEGRVGLDVLSRRRLDWRIGGPAQAPAAAQEQPSEQDDETDTEDPRRRLRAVT